MEPVRDPKPSFGLLLENIQRAAKRFCDGTQRAHLDQTLRWSADFEIRKVLYDSLQEIENEIGIKPFERVLFKPGLPKSPCPTDRPRAKDLRTRRRAEVDGF